MQKDPHKRFPAGKKSNDTGADRQLTLEQFKNMPWEEVWKRAIPIEDKEAFFRKHRPKG